jgi:hypothetical protein
LEVDGGVATFSHTDTEIEPAEKCARAEKNATGGNGFADVKIGRIRPDLTEFKGKATIEAAAQPGSEVSEFAIKEQVSNRSFAAHDFG